MTTPEWQLPGNPCVCCGIRIVSIDHHNEPCATSPHGRHMCQLPPREFKDDIYRLGIVGDAPDF